jgi:TatD DNase family protein
LKKFIDLGAFFTIGIEVNFTDHVRKIAELIPLNRILTETDNPGGPKMYLGEYGKPSLILEVTKSLASILGREESEILQIVNGNLMELIGDNPLWCTLGENRV